MIKSIITDGQGRGLKAAVTGSIAALADNALVVSVKPTVAVVGSINGIVNTGAAVEAAIRQTAYTEQTSNAQRSISSTVAADTAAGTGARTIKITFFSLSSTGRISGPFTEIITLSGVAAVNTSSSAIALIEKVEVLTVGTGGVNAGIIQLFAATGGGGGVFASVAVGARQTNYAHHYVANNRNCFLTNMYASSTAASAQIPLFGIRSLDYTVTNAAEKWVLQNYQAQGSVSLVSTVISTARKVAANSRILFYVTPSNGVVQNNSIEADFYETAV